jgi:2-keto-4-pentenoate hydratase
MLDRLLETRRTHRKAPLPSPSIALDVAYRVQDQLREALVARGERVIGWKAGLTGRIAQEFTGIHHPVSAFLLGDGVYATGDTVPLSRFAELVVEAEIAFVMKRDLSGPGVTPATALLAVEGALPALELPELRWEGNPTGGDLIADGVAGNAVVLGQPLTPVVGLDLALEGVVYEMNGRIMATSTAAEVLGNPPELARLAREQPRGARSWLSRRRPRDERIDLDAPASESGRRRDGALHPPRVRERALRVRRPWASS